jgi:DNA-binding NtrC family response regulator
MYLRFSLVVLLVILLFMLALRAIGSKLKSYTYERLIMGTCRGNCPVDESWLSRQPHIIRPQSDLGLSRKPAAEEKEIIEAALRESEGRVSGPSGAAAKLGMPRSTLESKIRSLKINKHYFKTTDLSVNPVNRF